ncbi:MAG TPA: hypothetical protein VHZ09_04530 [Acidobacteriaceae bacterium]|nr:hypothetical protein [Acidobacteriaceae bacterium]
MVTNTLAGAATACSGWKLAAALILAASLASGAFTPLSSIASAAFQTWLFFSIEQHAVLPVFVLPTAIAGALFLLGPGAYSVDALMFGRRLLRFPGSKR